MSKTATEHELLEKIKVLESEIKKLKKQKKYGLVWEDKPEEIVEDCKINVPILRLKEKSKTINPVITTDDSQGENILIEGDNYHALSVLNYTHKGKIDVIYIDPPYNTGKAYEWRYNDKWIDENDEYKHSRWISLIENRLKLAKNLLSETGIVFISIDDHEYAHLKLICDELFGEENFLANQIWRGMHTVRNSSKDFNGNTEYVLTYAKNKSKMIISGDPETYLRIEKDKTEDYKLNDGDGNGPYKLDPIYARNFYTPYEIKFDNDVVWSAPRGNYPRYSQDTLLDLYNRNALVFSGKEPKAKRYLKDVQDGVPPNTLLSSEVVGFNKDGTSLLHNIFGEKSFDQPKPISLIQYLLSIKNKKHNSKKWTILDFFAGSGTTGHAVLDLNKQDGGNRKFILCTNNENQICEEVTYERIKRVINGYENGKGEKVEGLGGNLRYYKTDLVNIEKLHNTPDQAKVKLTYQAGEMIGLKENTLTEVEKNDWWQIFESKNKTTAIYFKEDKEKLLELVDKLESKKQKAVLYIFSWGKNEYKSEYSSQYIKVEDIPEPILEVYKEINKI